MTKRKLASIDDDTNNVLKKQKIHEEEEVDEDEEIRRLQQKKLKQLERRLPGFNKKNKEKRLPAFDDEKTRKLFSEHLKRVLHDTSIPEKDQWAFPKAKIPVLVLAKGKYQKLIQVEKDSREKSRNRKLKKEEDTLILTRNHQLPTLASSVFEKEMKDITTRGVVKLLNQVIVARKKSLEVQEEVDDYAILKQISSSGLRKGALKNKKNNNKSKKH
jgi:hypothetical protein